MKYTIKDLPDECYSITPVDKSLLNGGFEVAVIIIDKGCKGYYKTNLRINSIELLKEMNLVTFGISDDNVRKIMQDYSVMGHWGLMRILNKEVA
jgi:hypothetical protein